MGLFFSIVFSAIGMGYFMYGKKLSEFMYMIFGAALMIYPYFVHDAILNMLIGMILCVLPFVLKKYIY